MNIKNWILAIRPKTLTAAVVPVIAATALVHQEGYPINILIVALALTGALAIQIATNLINDYIDFEKGADTAERLGPMRVTQNGIFKRAQVKTAAILFLVIAFLAGAPLVYLGGWPILCIGLVSVFMAYSYTGGPFPLAYLGLGDVFVVLFFGLIAVGGVYYLQTHTYTWDAFVLGLQIGFLATVLIAINNLRDVAQDIKVAKKTLAVRFGVEFAHGEILLLVLLPFLLQAYWAVRFGWVCAVLPLILVPLGLKIVRQVINTPPSAVFNKFLAQSAALHSGFGLVFSIGLFLR
jgi:1,4-dihydroxy-2-naphthoate polyprenyltransferase